MQQILTSFKIYSLIQARFVPDSQRGKGIAAIITNQAFEWAVSTPYHILIRLTC